MTNMAEKNLSHLIFCMKFKGNHFASQHEFRLNDVDVDAKAY